MMSQCFYRVSALETAGFEVVPTFRTPHVTISFTGDLADLGEPIDASGLVRIDLPIAEISEEEIVCHVLISDHYGNLTLNLDGTVLKESFLGRVDGVRVRTAAGPARMRVCRTFAEAIEDEAVLYTDSSGSLAMAVNHGSAAERLGLVPDDEIKLAPMP